MNTLRSPSVVIRVLLIALIIALGLLAFFVYQKVTDNDTGATTALSLSQGGLLATFTSPPPTPTRILATVTPQVTQVIPNTGDGLAEAGESIYQEVCAACHQPQGQGFADAYPPLNGSGFVNAQDPEPLVRVIITGRGGMPTFHEILSPAEIAAVVSYIRGAWNNQADQVDVQQVEQVWQQSGYPMKEGEDE
jgi:cytochrome c6